MEQLTEQDPTHIGPYRLIARLGEGGMGLVYLGRSDLGRTVAVKVVQADHAQHPEFRRRFTREVAAARRVGGNWTAAVLDADTEAAVPWVATQYIPGPDLTTVVGKEFGPLPEHSVHTLANRLALALQTVHEAGLIHRDLKPSNVLVTVDGPRVIDFGIARALDSIGGDSLLTRTGMLIGSPGFMSPEQVRGHELTPANDIFCLGAVLVYAATGRLLFGATDTGLNAHLFRIAEEEADLTGVPDSLVALVRACLNKDPAQRPTPAQVIERTATDRAEEWLPGSVLAHLGRRAAELLDFTPQPRGAQPDPRAQPASSAAQSQSQSQPTSYPLPPASSPAPHAPNPYASTAPANSGPGAGFGPPLAPLPGARPAPEAAPAPAPASTSFGSTGHGGGPLVRRWWGLAMGMVAQLVVLLDVSTATPRMLSEIGTDVGLGYSSEQWMYVGYALTFGGLLLVGGHLADVIGRKRTLLIGLTGFAVSTTVSALSPGLAALVGSQLSKGVFAALITPAALGLVAAQFTEPSARMRAIGIYAVIGLGGSTLTIGLAVPLASALASWRVSMYVIALLALIALIGTATLVRDPSGRRTPGSFDTLGALLSAFGVVALVFGFAESGAAGWGAPVPSVALACGILLLAAFARRQSKARNAILPTYPTRTRDSLGASVTLFMIGLALSAVIAPLNHFLYSNVGPVPTVVAFVLLPASFLVGSLLISARLLPRVGPRALLVPGLLVAAVGPLIQLAMGDSVAGIYPTVVCLGLGVGTAGTVLYSTIMDGIAAHDSGGRAGLTMVSQHMGTELGFALLAAAAGHRAGLFFLGHDALLQYLEAGALLVAALVGGLMVRARPSGGDADNAPPPYPAGGSVPTQATPDRRGASGLLLVKNGRVKRVPTELRGLELLQEISRLLRAENVTMTKLGTDLTLWHVEGAGQTPNPVASRLMAEHGFEPVTGAAVVAGPMVGHMPFPLGSEAAEGLALRLER
ncbi:bifunctional serine/threonine protein kinase/MFS transporter [Streptomyces sp. YH02]|uniref:bifunctional serine/threonine protein kinase/MFS transporter n=1 Tax=Streptomyces sp. YH02 TaxID=3256999 RepID=UPI0037576E2B